MKASDLKDQIANQIVAMMEKDGLQWVQRWRTPRPSCNGVNGHIYRGSNVLTTGIWLMAHGESDPRFIPRSHLFNTDEPVGKVRKGQRGIPIFFYGTAKKEDDNGEERRIPYAKVYYVWHVSQLDDVDESKLVPVNDGTINTDPGARDAAVDLYISNTGADIKDNGSSAFYHPASDSISIPPLEHFYSVKGIEAVELWYGTLLHELIHWTGAKHRLDRDKKYHTLEGRAYEELIAEMGAVMLGVQLGVQTQPREDNAAYVQGWIKNIKDRPNAIFEAAAAAGKAIEYMDELQTQIVEDAA